MAQRANRLTPPLQRIMARGFSPVGTDLDLKSPRTPTTSRSSHFRPSRLAPDTYGFLTPKLERMCPQTQRRRFLSARSGSPSGLSPGSQSPSAFCSPRKESGDRFIPARSRMNMEKIQFLISNQTSPQNAPDKTTQDVQKIKFLTFSNVSPKQLSPAGLSDDLAWAEKAYSKLKECKSPEKTLDAPEILLDYTLTLMDWSCSSEIALALSDVVYLWNSRTSKTRILCQTPEASYVTSVRWNKAGDCLAVGCSDGKLNCWMKKTKRAVVCQEHNKKIISLAWNGAKLCSGDRSGLIYHHDLDTDEPTVRRVKGHLGGVGWMDWSSTGRFLASGCTQGVVKIWSSDDPTRCLHVLTAETSAIRALTWCPWLASVFAVATSAGGLCTWRVAERPLAVTQAKSDSKITDLKWSPNTKELVSSHFDFSINIWTYPAMNISRKIKGHQGRVVTLCWSPDWTCLASVALDETLRFWKCFPKKDTSAKVDGMARISIR